MTYCVAIKTDSGLVFASDSLTNAGINHVSTYSKMHTFVKPGAGIPLQPSDAAERSCLNQHAWQCVVAPRCGYG